MKINPLDHLRLITRYASQYSYSSKEPFEDLFQEGYLGLDKAAKRFRPELGYQFSSFAVRHITGAITHYLRDKSNMIRNRGGDRIKCKSLDKLLYTDDTMTLLDTVASPEQKIEIDYPELYAAISSHLPYKQRQCIRLLLKDESREAIGQYVGISTTAVNNNIQRAKKTLKSVLDAKLLVS